MMMTKKQFDYIKALLVDNGHAHPKYGLNAGGRKVCGVPLSAMKWDSLQEYLTKRQASRLIEKLKLAQQIRR